MKSALLAALAFTASTAFAQITVPGTSDLWLAGAPDGTLASGGDSAPAQSPVLVSGISDTAHYFFSVTGAVANGPGQFSPAADGGFFLGHDAGAENGVSNLVAPINSLIGVFVDNSTPVTPGATLDFGSLGLNFLNFSPTLNQAFFIGDGLNDLAQSQAFFAPTGATRLFLGTMDGYEWTNNLGAYEVQISSAPNGGAVPEPSTYGAIAGAALVGLALLRRRRS